MARMLREIQQQVELQRGEVERRALVTHAALDRRNFKIAIADQAGLPLGMALGGALNIGAAQQGLDPCQQLGQREWLGQVVIGAQFQAQYTVEFGRLGGEHQDRGGVSARAQRLADLKSVHAGHHQIEDQQIAGLLVLAVQCRPAVGHCLYLVVGIAQVHDQQVADIGLVFSDK